MTDKNGFSGPEAIRDFLNPGKLPPTPLVELPPSLNPLDEEFQPLLHGMMPKGVYRPGTPNVAAIVGLGKAAEIAFEWNTPANRAALEAKREGLWEGLASALGDKVVRHGHSTPTI